MTYKALILDLYGTTALNEQYAMPTPNVIEAIGQAGKKLSVSVVTSHPLHEVQYILDVLDLSGVCILDHGARMYDSREKRYVREVSLSADQVQRIYEVFGEAKLPVYLFDDTQHKEYDGSPTDSPVFGLGTRAVPTEEADRLIERFSNIPLLSIHKSAASGTNGINIDITHANATKPHAVLELCRLLEITPKEIIGVGDSYNDYPLLMACGLRIAMGNAAAELKRIADFIAPSVEEEGVVTIVKKFILSA